MGYVKDQTLFFEWRLTRRNPTISALRKTSNKARFVPMFPELCPQISFIYPLCLL